ncbi:MAG: class I SAM-dependent methyltransferase [Planctomycetota bacterium]
MTPLSIAVDRLREMIDDLDNLGMLDRLGARTSEALRLLEGVEHYTEQCATPLSPSLQRLRDETEAGIWMTDGCDDLESEMLSGAAEAALLQLLIRTSGAKRALDIGMFTGFSSLAMAQALPSDGQVVACELNEQVAAFARHHFDHAPGGNRIDVRVGPAADTLRTFADAEETFDIVFLDADKAGYVDYYELVIGKGLLREGGLLLVDNTLLQGEPYQDGELSGNGQAIRRFNQIVLDDNRVEQVLLPLRDGVTLIRRVTS